MTTYDARTERALSNADVRDTHDEETGALIAASKVEGTSVYNSAGDDLGTIHDVMIDKRSGQVAYAVMSFGGFLGIGERFHPLPWNVLTYDQDKGGYNVDLSTEQLRGAPTYSHDELRKFGDRTHKERVSTYYGGLGYPPLI